MSDKFIEEILNTEKKREFIEDSCIKLTARCKALGEVSEKFLVEELNIHDKIKTLDTLKVMSKELLVISEELKDIFDLIM